MQIHHETLNHLFSFHFPLKKLVCTGLNFSPIKRCQRELVNGADFMMLIDHSTSHVSLSVIFPLPFSLIWRCVFGFCWIWLISPQYCFQSVDSKCFSRLSICSSVFCYSRVCLVSASPSLIYYDSIIKYNINSVYTIVLSPKLLGQFDYFILVFKRKDALNVFLRPDWKQQTFRI